MLFTRGLLPKMSISSTSWITGAGPAFLLAFFTRFPLVLGAAISGAGSTSLMTLLRLALL